MVKTMGKVMEERGKWWNTWGKVMEKKGKMVNTMEKVMENGENGGTHGKQKHEHAGICIYSTINNLG